MAGIKALGDPLLICNEDQSFILAEQMRQIEVEPGTILLEPMGRNTAPAVAVAALQATAQAEAGRLVTFGIMQPPLKRATATSKPLNLSSRGR